MEETVEPTKKIAEMGTFMFRRADVRGKVIKMRQFHHAAMRLALKEGRGEDADIYLAKVRAMKVFLDDLDTLPFFKNPEATEAVPKADVLAARQKGPSQ